MKNINEKKMNGRNIKWRKKRNVKNKEIDKIKGIYKFRWMNEMWVISIQSVCYQLTYLL